MTDRALRIGMGVLGAAGVALGAASLYSKNCDERESGYPRGSLASTRSPTRVGLASPSETSAPPEPGRPKRPDTIFYVDSYGMSWSLPPNTEVILAGKGVGSPRVCNVAAMSSLFVTGEQRMSLCVVPASKLDTDLGKCVDDVCETYWLAGDLQPTPPNVRPVARVDAETWQWLERQADPGRHLCVRDGGVSPCP